jgi:hypothetical protein
MRGGEHIAMDPEFSALENRAVELARRGEWGEAAELLNRRLLELAPSNSAAYTRLARCLQERGDAGGAEVLYRRVMEFDPANLIASKNLRRIELDRVQPRVDVPTRAGRQYTTSAGEGAVGRSSRAPQTPGNTEAIGLVNLHRQLEAQFANLQARRAKLTGGAPIFALEHGLSQGDVTFLKSEVLQAVRTGHMPQESWLPFVVYAAEVGYEYSGDEYWQTFEARTPGWVENGDRNYIRDRFRQFSAQYRGAKPAGVWAEQFTIICWPITHAVLPTDLQRQLARLLFDYRRALTSAVLDDPAEFGTRLAARAWQTSSRFQIFAQNTTLLGQVAIALLVGEEAESPYLLPATLQRIVGDLSKEREAWRLLRGAKSSATSVRIRGLRLREGDVPGSRTAGIRLPSAVDPDISLRLDGTWTVYLKVPDLTPLAERLPIVHTEAARLRAYVRGHAGPPLARGQLLYPGRQVRLSEWPSSGSPLIQLEGGSDSVNMLLADQCVLSAGPVWLFRIRDGLEAVEVRGKFVRPNQSYILLSLGPLPDQLPSWVTPTSCNTAGVRAHILQTPGIFDEQVIESSHSLGLNVMTDVRIRPAGIVPASWDGEGEAEYVLGDEPILAISSSRTLDKALLTLDGDPSLIRWPPGTREVFVRLDGLGLGSHRMQVSLVTVEDAPQAAEGWFDVIIRLPASRRSTGTFREGLVLLATPMNPTLTELWDGKASIDIVGPPGLDVVVEISLRSSSDGLLTRRALSATLPVDAIGWAKLANQLKEDEEIRRWYDESDVASVTVSHPGLGTVGLRCEREFTPLRWIADRKGVAPYLRLINNTENAATVEVLAFANPDRSIPTAVDAGMLLHWRPGGLVIARAGPSVASAILSPQIRVPSDLELLKVERVGRPARSYSGLMVLMDLARRWADASLPADPFAAAGQIHVQRAITSRMAGLIGGERWESLEQRASDNFDDINTSAFEEGVGDRPYQRSLARALLRATDRMVRLTPEDRAVLLAQVLAAYASGAGVQRGDFSFSQFLLRLASDPASLVATAEGTDRYRLDQVLESPFLFRAARFVVLTVHAMMEEDTGSTYRGWVWQ